MGQASLLSMLNHFGMSRGKRVVVDPKKVLRQVIEIRHRSLAEASGFLHRKAQTTWEERREERGAGKTRPT